MKTFHPLTVIAKRHETRDSVRIALDVPLADRGEFEFLPGQHLPIQLQRDGKKIRRTYSICSEQGQWPLEIGVRIQPHGVFSTFAADELSVGDTLDVMPPSGRFTARIGENADEKKTYLAFAAGSGITPILSMITSLLRDESACRVTLFYGNRKQSTTMFVDDLYALKNRYPDRLQLQFLFSQEEQEFEISSGRLDADKVRELYPLFCTGSNPSEAFICGPDTMIADVTAALKELGIATDSIHAERFGAPRKATTAVHSAVPGDDAEVTIIMDGHKKTFSMPRSGSNIVDAAADQGIELPFSCKGGVCATCRTHVREGGVDMATNYGLEPWEVKEGFVLACQSVPTTDAVLLDYDKA